MDDGYSYTFVDDVAIVKCGEELRRQNAFEPNVTYFVVPHRRRLPVSIPVLRKFDALAISSDGSSMAVVHSSRGWARELETRAAAPLRV